MRASDADRQRAIEELRRHCAAGRIDVDDFASRIERVLAAATLEELDEIRADLPMLRVAEPGGGRGVWASSRQSAPRLPMLLVGDGEGSAQVTARMRATAVIIAVVSVMVVIAAIAMAFAAEWVWAAILLAGWLTGLLQGRSRRGPRSPS
jgi:hypothetical protein